MSEADPGEVERFYCAPDAAAAIPEIKDRDLYVGNRSLQRSGIKFLQRGDRPSQASTSATPRMVGRRRPMCGSSRPWPLRMAARPDAPFFRGFGMKNHPTRWGWGDWSCVTSRLGSPPVAKARIH
jgi:hypothetical protein